MNDVKELLKKIVGSLDNQQLKIANAVVQFEILKRGLDKVEKPIFTSELNPISDLPIEPRIHDVLRSKGIIYLEDLQKFTLSELFSFPTFGAKRVYDLVCLMQQRGIKFKEK